MIAEVVGDISWAGFWLGAGLVAVGYGLTYFGKGH